MIYVGRDDVSQQNPKSDEQRLRRDREYRKVFHGALCQSLAHSQGEFPFQVLRFDGPELGVPIRKGAVDGAEFDWAVGCGVSVWEQSERRVVIVQGRAVIPDVGAEE